MGTIIKNGITYASSNSTAIYDVDGNEIKNTYLKKTDDISDTTVNFEESSERDNIESGNKSSQLFGKIKKWFHDLSEGAASSLLGNNLTGSKVLVSDESGKVTASDVTSMELKCLNGITSNIQEQLSELNTDLVDRVYPVGSIYLSTVATNPGELFGGTWMAWGTGRVPVGVDANNSNFNTGEKTGGSISNNYTPSGSVSGTALTVAQLPSHNHSVSITSGNNSVGHTHYISITSGGMSGNATAAFGNFALQSSSSGVAANGFSSVKPVTGAVGYAVNSKTGTSSYSDHVDMNIAHTHSVSGNTNGISANHTHSVSGNSANTGSGSTHTHTFTGTASTISTLQPYITCYMWKRTA